MHISAAEILWVTAALGMRRPTSEWVTEPLANEILPSAKWSLIPR